MKYDFLKHPLIILSFFVALSSYLGKILISVLPPFPVISDSLKYIEIAEGIQKGFYPAIEGIYYNPGYPYFLSKVFSYVGTSVTEIYQVQFFLLGVVAFLTYLLASRYLRIAFWLSFLVGLSVLVWPYMILYSLLVMSAVPYIVIILLAIILTLESLERASWKWFAITGVVFALAALMRPVALLLPFWLVGIGVVLHLLKFYKLPSLKNIAIGLVCFIITISPWMHFKSTSETQPDTTRQSSHVYEKAFVTLSYEEDRDLTEPVLLSDVVVSKLQNLYRFWNPGAGGYQAELLVEKKPATKYLIELYKVGFILILVLAFLSLLATLTTPLVLLWSVILYVWMLHTVLFPYPRYTLPVIPLVLVLAAFSLLNWREIYDNARGYLNKLIAYVR